MAEIGSAYVSLLPSAAGFGRATSRQIDPQMDRAGRSAGGRFSGGLKAAIGPAVALLGTAVVGSFLKGSVDQASDLNETLSKSSVIFGKQANAIENFGNKAAKSLGLSKEQAIASAAGFGDMFTQIGFTDKAAAKFAKSTVRMAADLGSFNNLETSDVTERLSAAFRGEYDSLQAVIPNINAARVESEALAKTGKKTAKELTAQEKAAAVLAIVSKDGARAQGDFARTSGGLANQQKILSAQTADLRAKIGTALLPILAKSATFVNGTVVPAISGFVSQMRSGTGAGGALVAKLRETGAAFVSVFGFIKANQAVFGAFVGTIVVLVGVIKIWTAVQTLLNIALTANPIGLIVVGIAALVAGVVYAYTHFEKFRNIVDSAFAAIRSAVSVAMPYVKSVISGALDVILGVVKTFKSLFTGNWKGVWEGVKQILRGAMAIVKTLIKAQFDAVVAIVRNVGPLLRSAAGAAFQKLKDGAQAGVSALLSFVRGIPGKIKGAFSGAGNLLKTIGGQIIDGLTAGIRAAAGKVMDAVNAVIDKIPLIIRKKMGIASPSKVTTKLGEFIGQGLVNGLRDGTGGMDAYLKEVTTKITDSLKLRKADLKRAKPGAGKKTRARISAYNDRERKSVAKYNDAARNAIKTQKAAVDQLAKSLSGLGGRIDQAKSDLKGLQDARASLSDQTASSISGELSLTETGGKKLSFATIAGNVSGLKARAMAFAGKLRALLAAGIPAGLVQEVASLGTVAGIGVANALLSGSQQQIGQLAADYAGIDTYSKQIGDVVAGSMYDAGIRAQEGLLQGLLNDASIKIAAEKLGSKLTKAVKKALGIKSPSRVFQNEVGKYIPAGVVAGIDDGQRALDRRVAGMVSVAKIGKVQPGDFGGGVAASGPAPIIQNIYPQPKQSEQEIGNAAASRLMWAMTS